MSTITKRRVVFREMRARVEELQLNRKEAYNEAIEDAAKLVEHITKPSRLIANMIRGLKKP